MTGIPWAQVGTVAAEPRDDGSLHLLPYVVDVRIRPVPLMDLQTHLAEGPLDWTDLRGPHNKLGHRLDEAGESEPLVQEQRSPGSKPVHHGERVPLANPLHDAEHRILVDLRHTVLGTTCRMDHQVLDLEEGDVPTVEPAGEGSHSHIADDPVVAAQNRGVHDVRRGWTVPPFPHLAGELSPMDDVVQREHPV